MAVVTLAVTHPARKCDLLSQPHAVSSSNFPGQENHGCFGQNNVFFSHGRAIFYL